MGSQDEQAYQPKYPRINRMQRRYRDLKSSARLTLHGWFWWTLFKLRLARPYSEFMCWRGWYRKYLDGRCHYCGKYHR